MSKDNTINELVANLEKEKLLNDEKIKYLTS